MVFSARSVVSIGYAALGVLFRRTLPAMATTLAVFTAVSRSLCPCGSGPTWARSATSAVSVVGSAGYCGASAGGDLRADKAPRIAVAVFSVRLAFTGSVAVSLSASVP
jgi:hypothetical protein